MINNLFTMFNSSSNNNEENNKDYSDNYNSQNSNPSSDSSSNHSNPFGSSGIDFETIMKMKSIVDKMNTKDDPRSNLLQSLKPYLKDSRKSKVDQYIQLMNMSKVMDVFPFMGGDKKK